MNDLTSNTVEPSTRKMLQDAAKDSKDCDMTCQSEKITTTIGRGFIPRYIAILAIGSMILVQPVSAGSIRIYDSAVVTTDNVLLSDLAALTDFSISQERALSMVVVSHSPEPGQFSIVLLQTVRESLRSQGVNFAEIMLHGAMRCEVSRVMINHVAQTNALTSPHNKLKLQKTQRLLNTGDVDQTHRSAEYQSINTKGSLKQAVIDYFRGELKRYHGKVDVTFSRDNEQMLGLSGPNYQFRVSPSSKMKIGLTSVRVDVFSGTELLQTIPLVVNVSLSRYLLSARHTINAKATIRESDVEMLPMVVTELDHAVLDEQSLAIGLRAKRFIARGRLIKQAMLESIPLVTRGQLVRLTSLAGGVSVVTAAKADENGHIGDAITVRSVDNKRIEFLATVVGPGRVQIGGKLPHILKIANADGGRK